MSYVVDNERVEVNADSGKLAWAVSFWHSPAGPVVSPYSPRDTGRETGKERAQLTGEHPPRGAE